MMFEFVFSFKPYSVYDVCILYIGIAEGLVATVFVLLCMTSRMEQTGIWEYLSA